MTRIIGEKKMNPLDYVCLDDNRIALLGTCTLYNYYTMWGRTVAIYGTEAAVIDCVD